LIGINCKRNFTSNFKRKTWTLRWYISV
jgi:hypothetical protein